jgi:outer membrane protein assembly factor BamB
LQLRKQAGVKLPSALAAGTAFLFVLSSFGLLVGPAHDPMAASASTYLSSAILLTPGGDFSTYLGNEERTSSSSSEQLINLTTAPSLHVLWTYNAGKRAVQSQPVEQNGIVYFGGNTGYEYAVNATSGTLLWKTFLGQDNNDTGCPGPIGVTSTATVSGSVLYVDGGYPYLYALNSSSGTIEWRALIGGSDNLGFYDWSSPLIYDNNAYVGIASDCDAPLVPAGLAEYSLATHTLVGHLNTSAPGKNGSSIWGSPSVNPATNTIFVATGNGYTKFGTTYSDSVIAVNASTLAVQASWKVPNSQVVGDGDFGVTPTVFTPTGGYPMVTAANKNGILYALFQSNLTLAWEQRICCVNVSEDEHISTAWGGGYVYALGSGATINGVNYNSSVFAFNPLTGAIVWERGFAQSSFQGYAAPLWFNQLLVVADQDTLLVFNATTGAILFQDTVGGPFGAAPSISRGEIFQGSRDDDVYAFDLFLNSTAHESRSAGAAPLVDSFAATGSGGIPPYSYAWKFGDGSTSTVQNPGHTFEAVGTYNVTVSITDLAGNVSTRHLTVEVTPGFNVTFAGAGLPKSTNWSVTMGGVVQASNTSEISFAESNGTYAYTVGSVPGYSANPSYGSVTVNGSRQNVSVTFSQEYSVVFTEHGLPLGTRWNVTIGAETIASNTSTIIFVEPNGTYAYQLGIVPGWKTTDAGSVHVAGAAASVTRTFTQVKYVVTFKEAGLPSETNWSVTVGTTTLWSTLTYINFHLPNGSYSYSVANVANYSRSQATGTFSVVGNAFTISANFHLVKYVVTFKEAGLPSETNWSVTVGTTTLWSTLTYINFHLPNGTYAYSVGNVTNYSRNPNGTFTVVSSGITIHLPFTLTKYLVTSTGSGLPIHTSRQTTIRSTTYSTTGTTISFDLSGRMFCYNAKSQGTG